MDNLNGRIVEWALEYIEEHGRVDWATELRPAIAAEFGAEIASHFSDLAFEGLRRKIKAALKRGNDAEAVMQTALPGFDLPKGIAVPSEGGGVIFISTLSATRADAEAHAMVQEANIVAAVRNRDVWAQKMDRLRPAWAVNPDWTIGECIDFLAVKV